MDRYELLLMAESSPERERWTARDRRLGRSVELVLLAGPVRLARVEAFLREAHVTSTLTHGAIPLVLDVGRAAQDRPYYVLPPTSGRPLTDVIAEVHAASPRGAWGTTADGWDFERLLDQLGHLADALAHAHERGVVHGSLNAERAWVEATLQVRGWGHAPIRSPYLAPEQQVGGATAPGPSADVYALGTILVLILIGEPPADTSEASLRLQLQDRRISPRLARLAREACALRPRHRPRNAGMFAEQLADARREARRDGLRHERFRQADRAYTLLPPKGRRVLAELLLRLLSPDGARASMAIVELERLGDLTPSQVDRIVTHAIAARLLSKQSDRDGVERTLVIADDELVSGWGLLRALLDADPQAVERREALDASARRWLAGGQRRSGLPRRRELADLEGWLRHAQPLLTPLEQRFIAAARAEHARATRGEHRARSVLLTLFGGVLAATSYGAFTLNQSRVSAEATALWQRSDTLLQRARTERPARAEALTAAALTITPHRQAAGDAILQKLRRPADRHSVFPVEPSAPVVAAGWRDDGDVLWSLSATGLLQRWRSDTGTPLPSLHIESEGVVAKNGTLLLTSDQSGTVHLTTLTGTARLPPLRHPERILALAADPEGERIATATATRLRIWPVPGLEPEFVRDLPQAATALEFWGEALVWGDAEGRLFRWAPPGEPRLLRTLDGPIHLLNARDDHLLAGTRVGDAWVLASDGAARPTAAVSAAALHPRGLQAAAEGSGRVVIRDIASGSIVDETDGGRVVALTWAEDSLLIATETGDLRVWQSAAVQRRRRIPCGETTAARIVRMGDQVLLRSGDVWCDAAGVLPGSGDVAAADPTRVIRGSPDEQVLTVWDRRSATVLGTLRLPIADLLAADADADALTTVSASGEVRRWSLQDGHLLTRTTLSTPLEAAWLRGGRVLGRTSSGIHGWALPDGRPLGPLVHVPPDAPATGAGIAVTPLAGRLRQWDLISWTTLPDRLGLPPFAVDRRGDALAWRRADDRIQIARSEVADMELDGTGRPTAIALDDDRVAIASSTRLEVWRLPDHAPTHTLPLQTAPTDLAFSRDGRLLMTDRGVIAWDLADEERTGPRSNLRVCADLEIVAVVPFPAPETAWAPAEHCGRRD